MAIRTEPGALEIIRNTVVSYKGTVGEPMDIASVAKIARVEPICVLASSLTGTKELYNILHGLLNIYAAYYLQAISILSAQLTDVRILKILDKTNPDRDIKTLLASGYLGYESYSEPVKGNIKTLSLQGCDYKLPLLNTDKQTAYASESIFDEDEGSVLSNSINKLDTFEKLGVAVGKVIDVKFKVKQDDAKMADEFSIPVVVKLDTVIVPSDVVNSITTSNTDEITLGSRFRDAIDGRISFIKDFLLASDLIKAQKKTMIKDPTGYYNQLLKRVNNSRMYSAISGNISLAGISAIIVMTEEEENEIQKKLGGKLTNSKISDIVFDNTSAMMLVVVDREWQRVTLIVKGGMVSQHSFDDFKTMSDKGNSDNIADMLKLLNLGQAPAF